MKLKIAVLPGDGIGPEVIRETRRIADVVAPDLALSLTSTDCPARLPSRDG